MTLHTAATCHCRCQQGTSGAFMCCPECDPNAYSECEHGEAEQWDCGVCGDAAKAREAEAISRQATLRGVE